MAGLTDMTVTYISQLEAGLHSPSFEKLECLADALGVEVFELFIKRNFGALPSKVNDIK